MGCSIAGLRTSKKIYLVLNQEFRKIPAEVKIDNSIDNSNAYQNRYQRLLKKIIYRKVKIEDIKSNLIKKHRRSSIKVAKKKSLGDDIIVDLTY